MIRPSDLPRATRLQEQLQAFDDRTGQLPGIRPPGYLSCLTQQLIDSIRRVEFVHHIRDSRRLDRRRMDPHHDLFDPLRAAVLNMRLGRVDEACWLTFLATHFGKHSRDGWNLTKAVYGRLDEPGLWDWATTTNDLLGFRRWLEDNCEQLTSRGRFSNHRKYESLRGNSAAGTGSVVASYIAWVGANGTQHELIRSAHRAVGQNPRETFDYLYRAMQVLRFGRLAKFDYLTMLGKLGIAPIEPGSAYLRESTGPLRGATLLFSGTDDVSTWRGSADSLLDSLDQIIEVGMQVLEDGLCNWQKSPSRYIAFKG